MGKKELITICGEKFKKKRTHFSFETPYMQIRNMKELKMLQKFPNLESVSLNGTNINDNGLQYLIQCPTVTNINLSFTTITDTGIGHLTALKKLEHLRLKETNISPKSIPYFNQMTHLISLQVHETQISGKDMEKLVLPHLEELFVNCDDAEDYDTLLALSKKMPSCEIIAKGKGTFYQGEFES
jgi:hypothetical protein